MPPTASSRPSTVWRPLVRPAIDRSFSAGPESSHAGDRRQQRPGIAGRVREVPRILPPMFRRGRANRPDWSWRGQASIDHVVALSNRAHPRARRSIESQTIP